MEPIVITEPPSIAQLMLEETKHQLRMASGDGEDNSMIRGFIEAAAGYAERFTNRRFLTQVVQSNFDCFPARIELPWPPLQAVVSIKYDDLAGDEQTLDSSLYVTTKRGITWCIVPAYGQSWPATRDFVDAVRVQYRVGYGDGLSALPDVLRTAIKLGVEQLYQGDEKAMQEAIERMLWQYKVVGVA